MFAVEPVSTLRQYMRDKAARLGISNLFVIDGFLHAIPLPAASAELLVTSQAVGWSLTEELAESERVVRTEEPRYTFSKCLLPAHGRTRCPSRYKRTDIGETPTSREISSCSAFGSRSAPDHRA